MWMQLAVGWNKSASLANAAWDWYLLHVLSVIRMNDRLKYTALRLTTRTDKYLGFSGDSKADCSQPCNVIKIFCIRLFIKNAFIVTLWRFTLRRRTYFDNFPILWHKAWRVICTILMSVNLCPNTFGRFEVRSTPVFSRSLFATIKILCVSGFVYRYRNRWHRTTEHYILEY